MLRPDPRCPKCLVDEVQFVWSHGLGVAWVPPEIWAVPRHSIWMIIDGRILDADWGNMRTTVYPNKVVALEFVHDTHPLKVEIRIGPK